MLYPVNLDLRGQACLVVGGGEVAARKVASLLKCGAKVTLVSLRFDPSVKKLFKKKKLQAIRRSFRSGDLKGQFLVIAATDDRALNSRISHLARRRRILVNAVDQPADCVFTVPSVMRRGPLTIAVSTNGASPALSKQIRLELSHRYGPEFGQFLKRMALARRELLRRIPSTKQRKHHFETMVKAFFKKRDKKWGV